MATTQTTITKKQENKGARGIINLTSTMGQTLKTFQGIYGKPLPDTDGLTVESWMEWHGVSRPIKGKRKGDYTPADIRGAWHENMKSGAKGEVMSVFKNVAAKYIVGEIGDPDCKQYRVFTREEAEKLDGKPLSVYKLVSVAGNKWSVATILKGLVQTRNYEKEYEKSEKSIEAFDAVEEYCIVDVTRNDDGTYTRTIEPISFGDIIF